MVEEKMVPRVEIIPHTDYRSFGPPSQRFSWHLMEGFQIIARSPESYNTEEEAKKSVGRLMRMIRQE